MTDISTSSDLTLRVGLLCAPAITIEFHGGYTDDYGRSIDGTVTFDRRDAGRRFRCTTAESYATVRDVVIGIGFHWEQRIDLSYPGDFELIAEGDGNLRLINTVSIEEYLCSVISSEMSADASPALLEAHAVISRSWVIAQILAHKHPGSCRCNPNRPESAAEKSEIIRWWDRQDHDTFDVCADDHCQRYQGLSQAHNPRVVEAIAATRGLVLTDSKGTLVDARFSKCCGGATELFGTCWSEQEHHECLQALADSPHPERLPDLRGAAEAARWIESRPAAFCSNPSAATLRQVLKGYDQQTTDFYRWTVTWDAEKLSENIRLRLPEARIGRIRSLTAVKRGTSGRIERLRLTGSDGEVVIGKELLIRKVLSESHLYSSAFTVRYDGFDADGYPSRIILHGAGWGHGVGLCQIGAAVMGEQGYSSAQILAHYFPGAKLTSATEIIKSV